MAPIPLPVTSNASQQTVPLPAAPSDPPTSRDIAAARRFNFDILQAHGRGQATNEDVTNASVYEARLVASVMGAPVWFLPAIQPFKDDLANMKAVVRGLRDEVRTLTDELQDVKDGLRGVEDVVEEVKGDLEEAKDHLEDLMNNDVDVVKEELEEVKNELENVKVELVDLKNPGRARRYMY